MTAGRWKQRGAPDCPDLPKLGKHSGGIAIHRDADSRVPREIVELKSVVAFGIWRTPFIAQSNIERQLGRDLPVILHVEGRLLRLVGHCGNQVQRGVVGVSGQNRGEWVALSMVVVAQAVIRLGSGYIA